jgi:hypothetical protein
MIETEVIRDAIETALGSSIGVYAFSTGQSAPAIRVDEGLDPFTEDPDVTGLEVVLTPSIAVAIAPVFGGWNQTFTMEISLKQWDITKKALPALALLLDAIAQFSELGTGQIKRVIRREKLDNIETITLEVWQSFLTGLDGS